MSFFHADVSKKFLIQRFVKIKVFSLLDMKLQCNMKLHFKFNQLFKFPLC